MKDSVSGNIANIRFDAAAGGTRFQVRVQPRAARTAIAGEWNGCLRLRIAAPPVDGAANDALVRWLADTLGRPASAIHIVAGQTGRTKRVHIEGLDPVRVAARLLGSAAP